MPGFPLVSPSDANTLDLQILEAPPPSRLSQPSVVYLERMPLHQNAAEHRLPGLSTSALPIDSIQHQVSTPCDPDNPNKDSSRHSGIQVVPPNNGSAESEHDLAAMVHDFMENGSFESDFPESSDGESGLPSCSRLFEALQALKFNTTFLEKELLSILSVFFPSVKDVDLFCLTSGTECKGACIRRMLVKHLRVLGYDAAICISKWQNSGKVPGVGEYEYIDVFFKGEKKTTERLIVDVDFQSQFEIARPTHSYAAALKCLPVIFVGSEEKLRHVLQVMAEAAKMSLKQNSMPLPPWRTLDYMLAKWLSPSERSANDIQRSICRGQDSSAWTDTGIKHCVEQLKNLKLCMVSELDKYHIQKPVNLERNRMLYFSTWPLSSGFAVS